MARFRLTDEELEELYKASQPVPYLIFGGLEPASPRDNALRVWRKVAERVGCDPESIDCANTGDDHDFEATPLSEKGANHVHR